MKRNDRNAAATLDSAANASEKSLRLTADRNTEQDWLKTNLARFTSMLQGQRDLTTVGQKLLSELLGVFNQNDGK